MKVIFLDIDGVLTTLSTKWKTFHPDCAKALRKLLDASGASIVLSSSWRHGFIDWRGTEGKLVSPKDAVKVMRELLTDAGIQGDRLIDKTPSLRCDVRGQEIDAWLKQHPEVTSFVILDDDDDMDVHINRLVQTSWGDGMNEKDADKAIQMLEAK